MITFGSVFRLLAARRRWEKVGVDRISHHGANFQ